MIMNNRLFISCIYVLTEQKDNYIVSTVKRIRTRKQTKQGNLDHSDSTINSVNNNGRKLIIITARFISWNACQ
jgi:hypothetical protein